MTAFGRLEHGLISSRELNLKRIPTELTPFQAYRRIKERTGYSFLLESVEGPLNLAEYSIIGFDPRLAWRLGDGASSFGGVEGDPLPPLRSLVHARPLRYQGARFVGGAVGYFSYDSIRHWERLPSTPRDDQGIPDAEFCVFDDSIVFDHRRGIVLYMYTGRNRFEEVASLLSRPEGGEPLEAGEPTSNMSEQEFCDAVLRAKEYIAAGDIFQVVLSRRLSFDYSGSLDDFYEALRILNPSPYMYYLSFGERVLIGSSPEMLVRVDDGVVETYPIAGTRRRGATLPEDQRLQEELLADPKERAEHVMLVDLARNDLGRVCRYGSVVVPEFMDVHKYSHVQHIVSRVVGELDPRFDEFDVLRAVFPAGTVSGAPKVRAMEVIDDLEPVRRGAYAGAVGYFSYNGNADFAITIRTLVAENGRGHVQVGAGIVADSIPEMEWLETQAKAEALLRALENGGRKKG